MVYYLIYNRISFINKRYPEGGVFACLKSKTTLSASTTSLLSKEVWKPDAIDIMSSGCIIILIFAINTASTRQKKKAFRLF